MAFMQLKTYRAPSMAEALAQVKKDLGSEAVILHTRSYKAGGIAGVGARSVVEITASDQAPRARPPRENRAESVRKPVEVLTGRSRQTSAAGSVEDADTNDFRPATYSRVQSASAARSSTPNPASDSLVANPVKITQGSVQAAPQAKSVTTPAVGAGAASVQTPTFAPSHAPHTPIAGDSRRGIEEELASIKRLIGQVLATSSGVGLADGPVSTVRSHLLRQGLDHALASEILHQAASQDPGAAASMPDRIAAVQRGMIDQLSARLRTTGGFPVAQVQPDGRPLTLTLIGPTGVGKTTTIAKLAAYYRLRQGKRVGLVTADTYRIAAVEQLRVYADILRLPLKVAMTPEELGEGCRALAANSDVILIDTAGRSPTDAVRLAELESFLRAASPHQTHLVVSAVLGEQSLARTLGRFEALHPTQIVLTKLDESASLAPVFNLLAGRRVPVGCVTTGQEVPDHIAPADARALAATLVAGEGNA
jgi:flagellar biosynthesis protein FlhF